MLWACEMLLLKTIILSKPVLAKLLAKTDLSLRAFATPKTARELIKIQTAGLTSGVSDVMVLRWSPRTCVSNKFPGDSDAAGTQTTLQKHGPLKLLLALLLYSESRKVRVTETCIVMLTLYVK